MKPRVKITTSTESPLPATGVNSGPAPEEIRTKAYEIYRARDGGPGDALTDWLEAERQLRAEQQPPTSAISVRPSAALATEFHSGPQRPTAPQRMSAK